MKLSKFVKAGDIKLTEIQKQKTQIEICNKYQATYLATPQNLKLGISDTVKLGLTPINGLRIKPDEGTSGWFIWAGEEFSEKDDFFKPFHVEHINEWDERIIKYLGLGPGWRFLIADNYEDVWFDEGLLKKQ